MKERMNKCLIPSWNPHSPQDIGCVVKQSSWAVPSQTTISNPSPLHKILIPLPFHFLMSEQCSASRAALTACSRRALAKADRSVLIGVCWGAQLVGSPGTSKWTLVSDSDYWYGTTVPCTSDHHSARIIFTSETWARHVGYSSLQWGDADRLPQLGKTGRFRAVIYEKRGTAAIFIQCGDKCLSAC